MAFDLLRVAVLLIPNLLVFCANFSPKLNSSPRLRASAVQLVFSGFSPCLSAVAGTEVLRRVVGFVFWLRPGCAVFLCGTLWRAVDFGLLSVSAVEYCLGLISVHQRYSAVKR